MVKTAIPDYTFYEATGFTESTDSGTKEGDR
jgi:hypothetical protein